MSLTVLIKSIAPLDLFMCYCFTRLNHSRCNWEFCFQQSTENTVKVNDLLATILNSVFSINLIPKTHHPHHEAWWWQHHAVWRLLCNRPWTACDTKRLNWWTKYRGILVKTYNCIYTIIYYTILQQDNTKQSQIYTGFFFLKNLNFRD